MKNRYRRFSTKDLGNMGVNSFEIEYKTIDVVCREVVAGILTVVANIKNDHLKAVQKQLPEWIVRIDSESVSMAEKQPLFPFAVTAETDDGTVIHADIHRLCRCQNVEGHRLLSQVMLATILPLVYRASKRTSNPYDHSVMKRWARVRFLWAA